MSTVRTKTLVTACTILIFLFISISYAEKPITRAPETLPYYQPQFYPYDSGEKALYRASWNGIPVAMAEIQTSPVWIEGKKFYQVQVEAKTSKVLDLIWKMRDTISSTFEAKTLAPSRFIFNQRENRKITDTQANFDRTMKKWIVHRKRGSKVRNHEFHSPNLLDPITAFYLARSLDFKVGDRLHFHVFGGKSRYLLELDVAAREPIKLDSGVYDAFKIVPQVTNISKSGYAGRMREAAVWISADQNRTPLVLTSKVFIGSVYIEKIEENGARLDPSDLELRLPH